jgi:aryl-phospho-beta-D-glucosidase BglC (GH1 family)
MNLFVAALFSACSVAMDLSSTFVDWNMFTATGVNLGGWLVQEPFIDTDFWAEFAGEAVDEWDACVALGPQCGPALEQRYSTFITNRDIDKLASAGITLLRIPTHYAAWIRVPGSQLHTGDQVQHLDRVATYAIRNYGMHIVVDLHSLPGGVNGVLIGEKEGNYNWFHNETALEYSYKAVDEVVAYIQASESPGSYTIAPINEPVDNRDLSTFGTPESLSEDGAAWVVRYINGVLQRAAAVNPRIPVMFQPGFIPVEFWAEQLPAEANLVFDIHHYYFAGRPSTPKNIAELINSDAEATPDDKKRFPIYVGEWAIETVANNTLEGRRTSLEAGLEAWGKISQGSAYWTAKCLGKDKVAGEGTKADYWSYEKFIDLGFFETPASSVDGQGRGSSEKTFTSPGSRTSQPLADLKQWMVVCGAVLPFDFF